MLHFLIGLALCIFIGERLWHYGVIIRLRREERREMRRIEALYNPKPPIEPAPSWLTGAILVFMAALVVGFALLRMA